MLIAITHSDPTIQDEILKDTLRDLGENITQTSLDPEQASGNLIRGLLETRGLFNDVHVVIVRGGFSKKEYAELFVPFLQPFVSSPHWWFFIEPGLTQLY